MATFPTHVSGSSLNQGYAHSQVNQYTNTNSSPSRTAYYMDDGTVFTSGSLTLNGDFDHQDTTVTDFPEEFYQRIDKGTGNLFGEASYVHQLGSADNEWAYSGISAVDDLWYVPFAMAPVVEFEWGNSNGSSPGGRYGFAMAGIWNQYTSLPSWAQYLPFYNWGRSRSGCITESPDGYNRFMPMVDYLHDREIGHGYSSNERLELIVNNVPSSCAGRPLLSANEPDLCPGQACYSYVELGRLAWLYRTWPGDHYTPVWSAEWSLNGPGSPTPWSWQASYTTGLNNPANTDLKNFIDYMEADSAWPMSNAPGFETIFDGIALHYYVDPWNLCPFIEDITGFDHCYDPESTGDDLVLRGTGSWMFHAVRYNEMLDLAESNGNLDVLITEYAPAITVRQDHITYMPCASGATIGDGIPADCVAEYLPSLRATIQYHGDQSSATLRGMLWFPAGGPDDEIPWENAHLFNKSTYGLTNPVGSDWKADAIANP